MDKNEQILEMITKMYKEMQNGFKDVNNKSDGLQAEMQEGFREAYNERQEIKMIIENDVNKNINLLVEGQRDINNKIDKILKFQDEKELITIRIEILENELNRLKARLDEIA